MKIIDTLKLFGEQSDQQKLPSFETDLLWAKRLSDLPDVTDVKTPFCIFGGSNSI